MFRFLSRMLDRSVGTCGHLGSAIIILIAVLSVIEIFRRYILGEPSIWAAELIVMLAALTYAFAGPFAQLYRRHIAITVLSERFPQWLAKAAEVIKLVVGLIYLSALLYGSGQMAWSALSGGERSGTAWDTPIPQIVKAALVIALVAFIVLLLRELLRTLYNIRRGKPLKNKPLPLFEEKDENNG